MQVEYNANEKLLMGGHYHGACDWNKEASDIDHCYKLYHVLSGRAELRTENCSFILEAGYSYFINGYILGEQRCLEDLAITDTDSDVVSRHFNIQIRDSDDPEKICMEEVGR